MLGVRLAALAVMGFSLLAGSWSFVLPDQDPFDTLILVNKYNKAPSVPVELVKPDVKPTKEALSENIYMRPVAAEALEELFAGAAQDGMELYATSGYRGYATQKAIFERRAKQKGEKLANQSVAKPGYSEHQTGLAMDVEGKSTLGIGLVEAFGDSPEGIWLAEHCWEYGFIIRYPKDKTDITGYVYEPWHIRYVGKEAAEEIYRSGLTFEEYIKIVCADRIRMLSPEENTENE